MNDFGHINMKLAVITRDDELFHFVRNCFPEDCQCTQFDQSASMMPAFSSNEFSGLLLDSDLSQEVQSRYLSLENRRVPLIVFGALRQPQFMTCSLEARADEIVLLPLDASELYLRTLHTLKRFKRVASDPRDLEVSFANYRLDRRGGTVTLRDNSSETKVRLTSREFAILWALSVAPGNYLSRQQIASAIWASNEDIVGRTLEQHMYTIRKKMKMNEESGARIRSIYACGYRLESN
ncbi:response regulator transcription factor [Caballeronia sp. SEWSISQ10-4 2]|uniref:response regulator transcription factor n=1 Tax=Caballeronia sp. SEWSISQ10-4 2 TaxID=2937438 RepID=UPI002651776F|nr:response regulator transcription factor [Caballeronia sp. SEWSISQ10-4 2]MDN7177108.1 response regulator transcription factor [Caballeronia sp. SEWSISQ10-4 2]